MLENIFNEELTFTSAYQTLKDEGNLVYEYNPFRNYRLSRTMFEYEDHLYDYKELDLYFGIKAYIEKDDTYQEIEGVDDILEFPVIWRKNGDDLDISKSPILRRRGELVNFETNELDIDINHPVDLLPLYSYDNSVNLIINDGLHQPRLINSRFSATERNKYQIVDRKGSNDTNIYDLGSEFDVDTSLQKKTKSIPELIYNGTFSSGNLSIGNYHFYFRYLDADGNESDFIAESGLISIFIGNTPYNIHTGVRNENSHKGVSFSLRNLDSGYLYLSVYYTLATADIFENSTVAAYKVLQKFLINSSSVSLIKLTGFEEITEVPLTDINLLYLVFSNVETLALCLNRLFFGNVESQNLNYKELIDLSLRFLPYYTTEPYDITNVVNEEYDTLINYLNSYYNSKFIYNKVGYWPGEIYRFGIVYILNDGTLSPVFNVRGIRELPSFENGQSIYSEIKYTLPKTDVRQYISYDEETNLIISSLNKVSTNLENCKGVIKFPESSTDDIYGVSFKIAEDQKEDVLNGLKSLGIRGYFFVRLKRIPTILCQAFTIGVDKLSHTPVIPYKEEGKVNYIAECFLSEESPKLTNDYNRRLYKISENLTDIAAICPDYDADLAHYNALFSGDVFTILRIKQVDLQRSPWNHRHYYENQNNVLVTNSKETVRIQSIEDNLKLTAIDDIMFSARAGEPEEVFRFEYAAHENRVTKATNLIRGSFGPFLGLKDCHFRSSLINIYIPDYNESNLSDYFLIRYNDKTPFYAISNRIDLSNYNSELINYRGDCYICLFTHRINRNFQDPSTPTNDTIVDPYCWENNWEMDNGVIKMDNIEKINLGDINAIQLGLWITFTLRSSKNLNIRTIDSSHVDEAALVGHDRAFFPYFPLSTRGVYKIPEGLCYNKGFEKSVSERYNFEVPDVPAIKNDFSNRISYSEVIVNDAFLNGARTFLGLNYRDYPKTYGSITKIVEWGGNLLCVFEHGICLIPVNERTVSGESSGGPVYINTDNVLPLNPRVVSDTFGSQWKDSIIKTPSGIYGVDTVGKKIWKTDGVNLQCISDFRVLEFLNRNISLTERELTPIIGIRNVKTHYNKFKNDIMFTFYDNLYGFEEKVWNLCWNEGVLKWITFYSWLPSYSENIHNQYFSFDRNTSKWISKLGVSNSNNEFSDGITLSNVLITEDSNYIGELSISDRLLPVGTGINVEISYTLERDNYRNDKMFEIKVGYPISDKDSECQWYNSIEQLPEKYEYSKVKYGLFRKNDYQDYCAELYVKEYTPEKGEEIVYLLDKPNSDDTTAPTKDTSIRQTLPDEKTLKDLYNLDLETYKDDRGRRINLTEPIGDIVKLLNIKAKINVLLDIKTITPLTEAYYLKSKNRIQIDEKYYESVVAVIPKYNMLFLTTDFWKHGQAGIIDIADKIYPTNWYGKQHPFEFEFVVANDPDQHKIFDSLEIISNKAEPESFHYEIVGECYDFAKDKKNMYIRQEATKELYLYNGSNIVFNPDYKELNSEHRPLVTGDPNPRYYDKSTIFPLYYSRQDTINEIEDFYHLYGNKDKYSPEDKNFSALAGAEIVRYENLDEYRIWNHTKAVDITKEGLLRGNMYYKEDKWDVQINPINLVLNNESKEDWDNIYKRSTEPQLYIVPAEYNLFPIPEDIKTDGLKKGLTLPEDWTRNVISWSDIHKINKEVKVKDKFIKIRIRYSGKDLAIITAIKTLYSISYA